MAAHIYLLPRMKHFKRNSFLQSGLGKMLNLLFFVLILFSCNTKENNVEIIWVQEQAKKIHIAEKLLADIPVTDMSNSVHVRLVKDNTHTNILGNYSVEKYLQFEPLVPFTRGLTYEVVINEKQVASFTIPLADQKDTPSIIAIYPEQDTLPENILKMYLHFSAPMREGFSGDFVRVINADKDTLNDVFLKMEPELWNEDRTVLTLWFDPGRIKRDLQPNLKLGNPLQKNSTYTLFISKQWQNAQGLSLNKNVTKSFWVKTRDSLSPNIHQWSIVSPPINTKSPLSVQLQEPLDHYLLLETLTIIDNSQKNLAGKWEIQNKDQIIHFTPNNPWQAGNYQLIIASQLEDLAGNNLNKVFDRDISKSKTPDNKPFYSRKFKVQ